MNSVRRLSLLMLLSCLCALSQQVFSQTADIADGRYYLYNVGSGKWLGAANNWGTQASLVEHPEFVTLAAQPDGTYTLESQVNNGGTSYWFDGSYMDTNNKAYLTITSTDGHYTISQGDIMYGYDGSSTVMSTTASGTNAQWIFYSEEEMMERLSTATQDNPVDATFLILDPNFGRNHRYVSSWTMEASNYNMSGGNNLNNCAESYHSVFTLSQTLANAPAGLYSISVQGFYRQDGTDNDNLPLFYANEVTAPFPLKTGTENSMSDASVSFTNGLYTIEPIQVQVEVDGGLTIGAKLENNTTLWCIWDNFVLTYYGQGAEVDYTSMWQSKLAEALALLADEKYANVKGSERTVLTAAANAQPSAGTSNEYKALIKVLSDAMLAFAAAAPAYDALATEITVAQGLGVSTTSAVNVATSSTTTAALAVSTTQDLKVAEYNYVKTNYTYDATNLIGSWSSTYSSLSGQDYAGDYHSYYDIYADGSTLSPMATQTLELPAGNYVFMVLGRGSSSSGTSQSMTVTTNSGNYSANFYMNGDVGLGTNRNGVTSFDIDDVAGFANGGQGRGWQWRYVAFSLTEQTAVTFTISGSISGAQWLSWDVPTLLSQSKPDIPDTPSNPEPYAALSNNNTVLTFYYDEHKVERRGMSIGPFTYDTDRPWHSARGTIQSVVFDSSFAGYSGVTSTAQWFNNCRNLTSITDIQNLNTSNVWNMWCMFAASGFTTLDLSTFNTEKVVDMRQMFQECENLRSLNVSSFNTANVTSMLQMFYHCTKLESLDVSNFNTQNVVNMSATFGALRSLTSIDISNLDTRNVTNMSGLFEYSSVLTTIFVGSKWSTAKVTESERMFYECTSLVGGAGTTYSSAHTDHTYARIDRAPASPGYFTDINGSAAPSAYATLSSDNTTLTFYYDGKMTLSNGMDAVGPFTSSDLPAWSAAKETITKVVFDKSFADFYDLTSTAFWFYNLRKLTTVTGLQYLNTGNVTDMRYMFNYCSALTSLDLSHFNTGKVTSMMYMFANCTNLKTVNLSSFNTSNVTNMTWMFCRSSSLTTLDLSSFNTDHVTNMRRMLCTCSALKTVYVGAAWSTASVTDGADMFTASEAIVGGKGTTYDSSHTDHTYARIDGGTALPGYFTGKGVSGCNMTLTTDAHSTVSYGNVQVHASAQTFMVSYGEAVKLDITTDAGYVVSKLVLSRNGTDTDVTSYIVDGQYSFVPTEDNISISVTSRQAFDVFASEGVDYEVLSMDDGAVMVTKVADAMQVEIPAEVTYQGKTFSVARLHNNAFNQCSSLLSVALPATVTDLSRSAFASCPHIAAIIWNAATAMPAQSINNPNLLVYVADASYAPQNVQNVVVNGICEHLVLTDAHPSLEGGTVGESGFFAPRSFNASLAEYTHEYTMQTPLGSNQGWETITLPFTVKKVTHDKQGEAAPFAAITGSDDIRKPFWLYGFATKGYSGRMFERAAEIEAYKPYLIAMPNTDDYKSEYILAGNVTFSAENVEVGATPAPSVQGWESYGRTTMVPVMQRVVAADNVYALNIGGEDERPAGSVFISNSRDVQPFQCYITLRNAQGAPRLLPIQELMDETTDIDALQEEMVNRQLYDLLGRKLDTDKNTGIVISNGKKQIRRRK